MITAGQVREAKEEGGGLEAGSTTGPRPHGKSHGWDRWRRVRLDTRLRPSTFHRWRDLQVLAKELARIDPAGWRKAATVDRLFSLMCCPLCHSSCELLHELEASTLMRSSRKVAGDAESRK
jgi:hypothetical protein